jgi:hypothetical protein
MFISLELYVSLQLFMIYFILMCVSGDSTFYFFLPQSFLLYLHHLSKSCTKLMLDINVEIHKIYVWFCQMYSENELSPNSRSGNK